MPLVSVIMSVYNDSEFLCLAIDSILNQSFKNFEFLIVNDGSTNPETQRILDSYHDERIKLFHFEENKGLPAALNFLLNVAQGDYIARMDGDDISTPYRFQQQIELMEAQHELDIVCGNIEKIGGKSGKWKIPNDDSSIKTSILWGSPVPHPTVMIRAKSLIDYDVKYNNFRYAQDYDLWARCALKGMIFGSTETTVLEYRVPNTVNENKAILQKNYSREIATRFIKESFGVDLSLSEYQSLIGENDSIISTYVWLTLMRKMLRNKPNFISKHVFMEKSINRLNIYNVHDSLIKRMLKRVAKKLVHF